MDLNPLVIWQQMSPINKIVIIILIALSIWSLYVCVERVIVFRKARKQSLLFARQATEHLKNDRAQAAIGPEARDAALHYAQQYLRASDAPGAVADVLKRAVDRAAAGREPAAASPVVVGPERVIEAVAQMTGLPADILDEDDPIDLGQVRAYFSRRVMGQDHAVAVVVDRVAMRTDPIR